MREGSSFSPKQEKSSSTREAEAQGTPSTPKDTKSQANMGDVDDASENFSNAEGIETAPQSLRVPTQIAYLPKPSTADRVIDELIRQNAEAIKLERQVSSLQSKFSDSNSVSSGGTISGNNIQYSVNISHGIKRQVIKSRNPKRLEPMHFRKREELEQRYSVNQRNSKPGNIAPSIGQIIIPK